MHANEDADEETTRSYEESEMARDSMHDFVSSFQAALDISDREEAQRAITEAQISQSQRIQREMNENEEALNARILSQRYPRVTPVLNSRSRTGRPARPRMVRRTANSHIICGKIGQALHDTTKCCFNHRGMCKFGAECKRENCYFAHFKNVQEKQNFCASCR